MFLLIVLAVMWGIIVVLNLQIVFILSVVFVIVFPHISQETRSAATLLISGFV